MVNQYKILDLLRGQPTVTNESISQTVGCSTKTVVKYLKKMEVAGVISRSSQSSKFSGSWFRKRTVKVHEKADEILYMQECGGCA